MRTELDIQYSFLRQLYFHLFNFFPAKVVAAFLLGVIIALASPLNGYISVAIAWVVLAVAQATIGAWAHGKRMAMIDRIISHCAKNAPYIVESRPLQNAVRGWIFLNFEAAEIIGAPEKVANLAQAQAAEFYGELIGKPNLRARNAPEWIPGEFQPGQASGDPEGAQASPSASGSLLDGFSKADQEAILRFQADKKTPRHPAISALFRDDDALGAYNECHGIFSIASVSPATDSGRKLVCRGLLLIGITDVVSQLHRLSDRSYLTLWDAVAHDAGLSSGDARLVILFHQSMRTSAPPYELINKGGESTVAFLKGNQGALLSAMLSVENYSEDSRIPDSFSKLS